MKHQDIDTFDKVVRFKRLSPCCKLFHVFMIWDLEEFKKHMASMDFHKYSVDQILPLLAPKISDAFLHYPLDEYEVQALYEPGNQPSGSYYITSRLAEELKSQCERWRKDRPPQAVGFLQFLNNTNTEFEIRLFEDLRFGK